MFISDNIHLEVEKVIDDIERRQEAPWNNGRINEQYTFPYLQELFEIINSGIPREEFFYQGNLYRIHSSHATDIKHVDEKKEKVIGQVSRYGSCLVLPITEYNDEVVAFSKNYNFTKPGVFSHVVPSKRYVAYHINTKDKYGIDVNKFLGNYGIETFYEKENEVLFPLMKEYVVKEYECTANQFKYYMRNMG